MGINDKSIFIFSLYLVIYQTDRIKPDLSFSLAFIWLLAVTYLHYWFPQKPQLVALNPGSHLSKIFPRNSITIIKYDSTPTAMYLC